MASETDESSASHSYEVFCTDCDFETTVDGTVYDALDVADDHKYQSKGHSVTTKIEGYTPETD